jgi:sugar O-acyltransferase (sialic acid O-acetyltransferase NeuD family)
MTSESNNLSGERKLVIVGAGGHGSELLAYLEGMPASGMRLLGFIDDNKPQGPWLSSRSLGGLDELALLAGKGQRSVVNYITAFGDNVIRCLVVRAIEKMELSNLRPWTLRHPSSQVGSHVEIGNGTLLAPNTIVTTRARIGDHCILNVRASVSHDCWIGDFVNLNPAAVVCGSVKIGDGSYVGAGAIVKDRVRIGRGVTVGAGAVVIRDLPDGVTAVGVPAQVIKENSIDWLKA